MATFEGYERRIDKINAVLKEYGFTDLDQMAQYVKDQGVDAEGIVRGSLDGLLYLQNVDADVQVSVGDLVLTSGLGGSYVRGLLIGTVVKVEGSAGDATRTIVVSPNDMVSVLEDVLVVKEDEVLASSQGDGL